MSRSKRPWGVIAGPIIFFGGLAIFFGAEKAQGVKDMVEDWTHELEHSAEPVVMDLPVYVPLFVSGDWVGRLNSIVVERDRPGAVDGLQLLAQVGHEEDLSRLESCALRIHPPSGDIAQFKRALRCVSDTDGLVAFGHLNVAEMDMNVPLFVRMEDLPCDRAFASGPCGRLESEMQEELQELADELRASAEEFRAEAQRIKRTVRVQVRDRLRGR